MAHDALACLLGVGRLQAEHCHQVIKLKVDSCRSDYLQKCDHEERIAKGNGVKYDKSAENGSGNQRGSNPRHNGVEQLRDRILCHALISWYHGQDEAGRQEYSVNDKKYLRENHHAREQEYKGRDTDIEDEQGYYHV